jgi:hypothetical protein
MPEFSYAKGRILESIQFISEEMKEFQEDYAGKAWQEYQADRKLQKLMDRTVENSLTALIEVCGTINTLRGVSVESYGDAVKKAAEWLGFSEDDHRNPGQGSRTKRLIRLPRRRASDPVPSAAKESSSSLCSLPFDL